MSSALAHVIPKGFPPGSDVGNMSIMGYDPAVYHTGRSPLEAASMGVALGPKDIAFRCNLVSLSGKRQRNLHGGFHFRPHQH